MDKIIGSGNVVRLRTLIASGEINDYTILEIYDPVGRLISRGHWYQDRVLDLKNIFGTATCYNDESGDIVVGFKVY